MDEQTFKNIHSARLVSEARVAGNVTWLFPNMVRYGESSAAESGVDDMKRLLEAADAVETGPFEYECCNHTAVTVSGLIKRQRYDNNPIVFGGWNAGCAVSDQYKFIYVHVLKNGGSGTKAWLQKALCTKGVGACDDETLRIVACEAEMKAHPDYFRWTLARSVESRAVSIWAMSLWFSGKYELSDFWNQDDRWSKTGLSKDHGREQADFLTDKDGYLAVDYVGRLSTGAQDLAKIAKLLKIQDMTDYLKANGFKKPVHSNSFGTDKMEEIGSDVHSYVTKVDAESGINKNFPRDIKMGF